METEADGFVKTGYVADKKITTAATRRMFCLIFFLAINPAFTHLVYLYHFCWQHGDSSLLHSHPLLWTASFSTEVDKFAFVPFQNDDSCSKYQRREI